MTSMVMKIVMYVVQRVVVAGTRLATKRTGRRRRRQLEGYPADSGYELFPATA